jgi:hypothetical protein
MPDRRGKFEDIDLIAFERVFEHRPILADHRRDVFRRFLVVIEIGVAQFLLRQPLRKAEGHGAPLAGEAVDQQTKTFGAARHFVEQHRRSVVGRHGHVGCQADLFLPACAEHRFDFAELLRLAEPFAQIGKGDVGLNL